MNVQRIWDISPLVSPKLLVWPGDVPYESRRSLDMTAGDHLTLGSFSATFHLGAHVDAPLHFERDGVAISDCALEPYLGAAQVMRVASASGAPGARIFPRDLLQPVTAQRLLLRTDSFPDPSVFRPDFNSLSPELIAFLSERDVVLVGIDTPSIDPMDDRALESHHALAACGMRNLEGLVLAHVPDGLYTLVALPLRLAGADASPVRAVLLDEVNETR